MHDGKKFYNVRTGVCTEADIMEINKLVLTRDECEVPDFSTCVEGCTVGDTNK